ncbi:MAG: hypothetical protein EON47_15915 [Acetobacteraceae bacterium]|nr:MAG: hypothetical protein EON47_15915 [Acetobacteraceae bacterium]
MVLEAGTIHLRGASAVEDAEVLLGLLQADPPPPVNLQAATGLHAAVVQVLMVMQPMVTGPANDPFVNRWLLPILLKNPAAEPT